MKIYRAGYSGDRFPPEIISYALRLVAKPNGGRSESQAGEPQPQFAGHGNRLCEMQEIALFTWKPYGGYPSALHVEVAAAQ
jgi:hypothetical protein